MNTLAGFPFFPLHADRNADPVDTAEAEAVFDHVASSSPGDVLVLAHGWNNDLDEARLLFERLLTNLASTGHVPADLPVVGVFWPSKRFAPSHAISGGAASVGGDAPDDALRNELDALASVVDPDTASKLQLARDLVPLLDEPGTQDALVGALRAALPEDDPADDLADQVPSRLRDERGRDLLNRLAPPLPPQLSSGAPRPDGASGGGAAGLGDVLRGVRAAALRAANLTTYYVMKHRAGLVGRRVVAPLLDRLSKATPGVRIHLVGHSFGGRLVAATAAQVDAPVQSLTLLQAAFSHHGFAQAFDGARDGGFRTVLSAGRVRGPILITHTANDGAVGLAYPLASRLAGQDAAGLGGPDDPFGGIGRNGAQHTPEATSARLLPVGSDYTFRDGEVHNLLADEFIPDHGTVYGPEVASALAAAISRT